MGEGGSLSGGEALRAAVADILPLPRSLTGPGVRETLRRLAAHVPLEVVEVPTGTPALDWAVPDEWVLRRAVLTGPDGAVVADTDVSPLHVVGYSTPVDVALPLDELQPHLHSEPATPDAIPFRTSYYSRTWGFCLPDRVRRSLPDGTYRAVVDADLGPGHMAWGELVLPGTSGREVLVTSHVCHPAMANDNATGNVVAAALAQRLAAAGPTRHTWRFLWLPGTIGELTWLARHRDAVVERTLAGLVLTGLGDPGPLTWKRSRRGDSLVDRAAVHVLASTGVPHDVVSYSPWGYAERQFCSPGFDLGVGRLARTEHGTYPEYHTSADDLSFVDADQLLEALDVAAAIADVLERSGTYVNRRPHGEPRLGARGLYPSMGGAAAREAQLAMLWVLSESDGVTDLLAIADRSGLPFRAIATAADRLAGTDLLDRVEEGRGVHR